MTEHNSAINQEQTKSDGPPITQLFEAVQAGDEDAANQLFQLYRKRVAGRAHQILPYRADPADVSDVVQSVLAAVFLRARDEKRERGSENPWITNRGDLERYLMKVAFHVSIRRARKICASPVNISELELSLTQCADQDLQTDLNEASELIATRLKAEKNPLALLVFELLLRDTLTQQQIAEQLNCSVSTVERKIAFIRSIAKSEADGK